MKLSELKVQSFITELNHQQIQTIKGADSGNNCNLATVNIANCPPTYFCPPQIKNPNIERQKIGDNWVY